MVTCIKIDKFKHFGMKYVFCFVIKYISSVFTAFCPYHIGHFTMVGLKMDDMVGHLRSLVLPFSFSLLISLIM